MNTPENETNGRCGTKRVLVLDDNPDDSLVAALNAKCYEVFFSASGSGAEETGGAEYDVFFVDYNMGDQFTPGTGLDVAMDLKNAHPTVPFVMTSGGNGSKNAAETIAFLRRSGVRHVLKKPVIPEELDRLFSSLRLGEKN